MAGMALWDLSKAIFAHGNRRWLVLTLPVFTVAGATFATNYITPLPTNIAVAFIWVPQWWTWILAGLLGLFLAVASAWIELFNEIRTLTGRPDITLGCYPDGNLTVTNN